MYNFLVVIDANSVIGSVEKDEVLGVILPAFGRYLGIVLPSSFGIIVLTALSIFIFAKKRVSNPINILTGEVRASKLDRYVSLPRSKNEIQELGSVFQKFYNEKKTVKADSNSAVDAKVIVMQEETTLNLHYEEAKQGKIAEDVEKFLSAKLEVQPTSY